MLFKRASIDLSDKVIFLAHRKGKRSLLVWRKRISADDRSAQPLPTFRLSSVPPGRTDIVILQELVRPAAGVDNPRIPLDVDGPFCLDVVGKFVPHEVRTFGDIGPFRHFDPAGPGGLDRFVGKDDCVAEVDFAQRVSIARRASS